MSLILIYTAIWLLIFAICRVMIFRFDVMFTGLLFVSALLGTLPLVDYPQAIRFETQFLIVLVHFPICIGFNLIGARSVQGIRTQDHTLLDVPRYPLLETVLIRMAALFVGLSVLKWGLTQQIPLASNILALNEIRSAHSFTQATSDTLGRILSLLSHFGFLYVALSPLYARGSRRKIAFAVLCAVAIADISLSSGGRATIVLLAIVLAATYVSLSRLSLRQILQGGIALSLAFYVLGGLFYLARNPNFAHNPELFLAHNCSGASYHPLIEDAGITIKAMALSSCYFSSPALSLQNFMGAVGSDWTPRLGSYMLSILFREEFVQTRLEIAEIFARLGMATNPWATFSRDLFVDFGYLMSIPALLIGVLLRRLIAAGPLASDLHLARFAVLAAAGFFAAFMSPFIIRPIVYPLMILLVLPLLLPLIQAQRPKNRPTAPRPSATRL